MGAAHALLAATRATREWTWLEWSLANGAGDPGREVAVVDVDLPVA
jgi:hypothetical protein